MQSRIVPAVLLGALLAFPGPDRLEAQTDFYNLDKDRPLRVEDAFATKRWAFELKASPLTLVRDRGGTVHYAPSLELKHGLLPGMELSAGYHRDHRAVEISSLLNLWIEAHRLPALGLRVTALVPTEGERSSYLEIKGLVTRTLAGPVRAHINGGLLAGGGRSEDWWAGMALDWVLPFQHLLLLADTWVATPASGERDVYSGGGVRLQLSPTLVLDTGGRRSWTGELGDRWKLTLGLTHEFGVRALIPGGPR